ncbi:MAG: beta galactosidase jelly roll domain-containing protein, partial [Chitinispirillaceae bacterium]|nr:beta galactosidase jelly roll domain-containing protein [Chitinispirillaceae bacterium]
MWEKIGVTYSAGTAAVLLCLVSMVFSQASNRVKMNFNLGWKYYRGEAAGAEANSFGDGSWTNVVLPHSIDWVTPDNDAAYQGVAWYRKHFSLGSGYQERKVFVEFEGVTQRAQVWVNGVSKGSYEGGYMGFVFDITGQVSFTGENVIAVKIDTRPNAGWAPGKLDVDFRQYGGLYRDAWLHITDKLHVTHELFANTVAGGGVFVTYPSVSQSSAAVNVKTQVINEDGVTANCTIVSDIIDVTGAVAGTATATALIAALASNTFSKSITIPNPKLWSHLAPNCYTLRTTVKNGAATVDLLTTRIGIRRIGWTRSNGIQLNGANYKLRGTNEHQDIYGLGYAIPNRALFYEVKMIKEA